MKILFVNIPTGKEDGAFGGFAKNAYVPLLKRNLEPVKRKDTEIVYRFCEWGMGPIEMAFCRYMDHLASRMVFFSAQHAKEEGFDAVVINCFGDPMLREVRQALDIPVVGIGEATMLMSSLMGYKFGIVHISPLNIPETMEHVHAYGLAERCAGIRPIADWDTGEEADLNDARQTIRAFSKTARELIADGADVIIPGCSLMSPSIRLAPGAEDDYPSGMTEIDGVPVADVLGQAIKLAESMADIKKSGASWISRKLLYAQPSDEVKEIGKIVTENSGLQFWDVR